MQGESERREYNYAIAVLKIVSSFLVIVVHFWAGGWDNVNTLPKKLLVYFSEGAVPVFVIISFYLTSKMFFDHSFIKLKKRVIRLMYPYYAWAVICFGGVTIIYSFFHIERHYGIKDFLWQIALGSSDTYICPQLWYQLDLMILTVTMFFIVARFNDDSIKILSILSMIALLLQYFGINKAIFGRLSHDAGFAMGELMEILPMAVCGLVISQKKIVAKLKNNKLFWFVFLVLVDVVTFLGGFTRSAGFSYGGTKVTAHAVATFLAVNIIPFQNVSNKLKEIIRFLAKYSLGIFCAHYTVGILLNNILAKLGSPTNTLLECIEIYIISITISVVLGQIPFKYVKQLVE